MVRRNVEEVKIGKWRGNQRGFPAFSGYLANNRTLGHSFCHVKARTIGEEILLRCLIIRDLD